RVGDERDFFAGGESFNQLCSAHGFVVLVMTDERFFDLIMLQQNPGVSRVLGCDKIDIFQNLQRTQGDVSEVSDWSSDDVKHLVNLIKPTCLTRNERYTEGIIMRIRIWILALAPFALLGCAEEAPPPVTTTTTTTTQEVTTGVPTGPVVTREVVVPQAPPTVRVEAQTVAPGPEYVWVRGYWQWTGTRYAWVSGHWVSRPRTTAVWVQGHWVSRGAGWVWVPGHWR